MKVVIKTASSKGHDQQTVTVAEAIEQWPIAPNAVIAVDGKVVQNQEEFGKELSDLVDQKREEVAVDVVPQIAGGSR